MSRRGAGRAAGVAAAAVVAALSGGRATAGPPGADGAPGAEDVERAIASAVRWLRPRAAALRDGLRDGRPSRPGAGYEHGTLSLACLALLRAGVPPDALDAEFEALAGTCPHRTYELALYTLALDARTITRHVDPASDDLRTRARYQAGPAAPALQRELAAVALRLARLEDGLGRWGYGAHDRGRYYDHSNTQLAVYALAAASTHGVAIPRELWERVAAHFLRVQERAPAAPAPAPGGWADVVLGPGSPLALPGEVPGGDATRVRRPDGDASGAREAAPVARGWGYLEQAATTPTMTAAGASCLALALERLLDGAPAERRARLAASARAALRDGARWLVDHYRPAPAAAGGYERYGLEKALSALGLRSVGGFDPWLAAVPPTLAAQAPDGAWGPGDVAETAFTTLFLCRATLSPAQVARERAGQGAPPPPARPAGRVRTGAGADGTHEERAVVALPAGERVDLGALLEALPLLRGRAAAEALTQAKAAWAALPVGDRLGRVAGLQGAAAGADDAAAAWAERELRAVTGTRERPRHDQARLLAERLAAGPAAGEDDAPADDLLAAALREPAAPPGLRRGALEALARRGDAARVVGPLLVELARRDVEDRRWAWGVLVAAVGEVLPFDPDAPAATREEALGAWRAWWDGPAGRAVAGAGRP